MRIAIVSTLQGYSWAGTEEVWYHFARHAMDAGHQVMLGADEAVASSTQVEELKEMGLKAAARRPFKPMRVFMMKQRFLPDMRAIRAFSPDVLLINSGSPLDHFYSPYIWDFCLSLPCPKVFFCHFNSDRLRIPNRSNLLQSFQHMDGIVFVSEANKRLLERQLGGSIGRAEVILNAPRLHLDKPLPWPKGDEIHFAQVARLETEWKGHDILIETLSRKEWKNRSWRLTLYGNGPEEDYIRRLIAFYGLEKKVKMGGYVRDMREVYASSHALLLPSRGEGTPLAALEAMMCGRPVVATDVGGNAEIIEDAVSGFIAEGPTTRSFGGALERAWSRRDDWPALGRCAHLRARELAESDPAARLLNFVSSVRT